MFGVAAALTILPVLPALARPIVNPDAALMALCDGIAVHAERWTILSDECCQLRFGTPRELELSAALQAMVSPLQSMQDQLADMPAHTLAGLRAKAGGLRQRLAAGVHDLEPMDPDDNLAWSLAEDVLRLIGGAA